MKVKELIEHLQKQNPENIVVTNGYEGGIYEIDVVRGAKLKLNVNTAWYYGPHEEEESGDTTATFIGG